MVDRASLSTACCPGADQDTQAGGILSNPCHSPLVYPAGSYSSCNAQLQVTSSGKPSLMPQSRGGGLLYAKVSFLQALLPSIAKW